MIVGDFGSQEGVDRLGRRRLRPGTSGGRNKGLNTGLRYDRRHARSRGTAGRAAAQAHEGDTHQTDQLRADGAPIEVHATGS